MTGGAAAARVDRADGERRCGAAGAADVAVRRARRPVVPGRCDHERVEHRGARRGPAERAVLEGRKGLDDADQRDPCGVVGIAVGVGIDGQLHSGQDLIGAAVDGDTAGSVRLPSCDADRQQRGTRRDALQPRRAARAGDEARHLRAMALRAARLGRILARTRIPERVEHVETADQRGPDVGVDEVDTGVEEGDGDAGAGEAWDPEIGPAASSGAGEVVDRTRVDGCGDGRAHRVDALDVGVFLDDRQRAGVERGCEAVEDAQERVLRLDRGTAEREPGENVALGAARLHGPPALALLRCMTACGEDVGGERGLREDDDPAVAELGGGAVAEEALPPGGARRRLVGAARSRAEEQRQRDERKRGDAPQLTPPTHTHPGRGPRASEPAR